MRLLYFLIIAIGFSNLSSAQILDPVKWKTEYKQISDTEFDLIYTAKIDDKWAIYSQYLENDDGPIATSFEYEAGDHFKLLGKNVETGHKKEVYDKVFEMNLIKFKETAVFTQRVKVSDFSKPIAGYLTFMTCDDSRCLPPTDVDFEFKIEKKAGKSDTGAADQPEKKAEKVVEAETFQIPENIVQQDFSGQGSGILNPVKWSISINKKSEGKYEVVTTANIDEGWSVYSQFLESEDGPIATSFTYDEGDHFKLIGKNEESGHIKESYDKVFEMNLSKFKKTAIFTQQIEVNDIEKPFHGYLTFMTCDDTKCLPPTDVDIFIDASQLQAFVGDEATKKIEISKGAKNDNLQATGPYAVPVVDLDNPLGECSDYQTVKETKGIWGIFLLGLFGGFIALLTPCVFPMIPLTVSFFTKGSENRKKGMINAFWYGFFIFAVYLALSIPFHLLDNINPDILNDISTNVILNLVFFAIFLFFAFSFFGYYELTIPTSWTNKISNAEGIGGIIGIFFMALTLALVSFSCTGPILGSLLAGALSADGGAMQLSAGMGGFGFALALPFGLFAAFPSLMNSIPKSGGWLNTVKVVLGFLEIALALKFLSNADLVKHWGLLKIEPFLILWILTFIGLGLYLFGKIKFPHDSPIKKLSFVRIAVGVISFSFAVYLVTGFRYNDKTGTFTPLSILSGLAPPVGYSWIYPNECPNNLDCFKDLDTGWAYAKEKGKPIMIDFTGHACVNCRKMEENVWPDQRVNDLLKNDYVLISLYVDDKIDLPENEQIVVEKATGGSRKLRNYGHKWSHFQTKYFETNTQPYYVLLSPEGKLLSNPIGYTPDTEKYANYLECGIETFNKQKSVTLGVK